MYSLCNYHAIHFAANRMVEISPKNMYFKQIIVFFVTSWELTTTNEVNVRHPFKLLKIQSFQTRSDIKH